MDWSDCTGVYAEGWVEEWKYCVGSGGLGWIEEWKYCVGSGRIGWIDDWIHCAGSVVVWIFSFVMTRLCWQRRRSILMYL